MINKRTFWGIHLATRRTRRWLVVGYWAVVLALLALLSRLIGEPNHLIRDYWFLGIWITPFLLGFLGGTRPSGPVRDFLGRSSERPELLENTVKTLRDPGNREWTKEDRPLDERDIKLRNDAHYKAYGVMRGVALFGFLAVVYQQIPQAPNVREPLLWLLLTVIWSLPQSIILWTEPDMEEAESHAA